MPAFPRVNQIVSLVSQLCVAWGIIEVKTDVERTIQFILDQQAKSEARWQRAEERMNKAEGRMDKFDRRLNAIAKLVQTGMKMLNRAAEEQREIRANMKQTQASIQDLAAAQKRTDQKFERLVELLSRRSPNGRR